TIVLGILITNLVNYTLRNSGDDAWRWMFSLGVIPSGLFLAGAYFLPESPRWLMKDGKDEKAKQILHKIGGQDFVEESVVSIKRSLEGVTRTNYADAFKAA